MKELKATMNMIPSYVLHRDTYKKNLRRRLKLKHIKEYKLNRMLYDICMDELDFMT